MKRNYPIALILFWLFVGSTQMLLAQIRDTVILNSVSIHETRNIIFNTGKNVFTLDSSILASSTHQNVGDVLSKTSAIFIKSYGAGSSSTLSSRGTEARHSSVLWNGFNLNSSSLGLVDLSMIPVHSTDNISIIHGGSSAINGNSSIGSTILLNRNNALFSNNSNLNLNLESGSFGNRHAAIRMHLSNKSLESKTVLFYDGALNNFKFINTAHRDKPEMKLQHAAYQNYGMLQDVDYKIRSNQYLSASAWYQVTHREIPPMMTVPESHAEQKDSILRFYAGYKVVYDKSVFRINGGYFREFQQYSDLHYGIYKKYLVNNIFGDADWRWYAGKKIVINPGISFNRATASFNEYATTKYRQLFGVHVSAIYFPVDNWTLNLNIRREFSNSVQPPFSPSIGIEGNLYRKHIILKANAGRHFSIPSMNDLHWNPGGNPNLLPEDALSVEGGLEFFRHHKFMPNLSFMVFHSIVDNWIKWTPGLGGIYRPENIAQVKTKGIESSINYKVKLGNVNTTLVFNYTWCKSTITKTDEVYGEQLIGKQLMYAPEHITGIVLSAVYRNFEVTLLNTYTGIRYTSGDNSSYLNAYITTDMVLSKKLQIKKQNMQFFFKILNLFDTTYQVMAYRPTPGRWYSIGLKYNFNLKPSTKKQN